jgi:hypothetical protein
MKCDPRAGKRNAVDINSSPVLPLVSDGTVTDLEIFTVSGKLFELNVEKQFSLAEPLDFSVEFGARRCTRVQVQEMSLHVRI